MEPASALRACAVFLVSAAGCLAAGRPAIAWLVRLRWRASMRHEDCPPLAPLQEGKRGTPTMGGLLVIGVAALAAAAFGGLSSPEGWLILASAVSVGLVGLADDLLKLSGANARGLRCMPKLLAALAVGAVVGWLLSAWQPGYQGVLVPWVGRRLQIGALWLPLAMSVIAGSSHAVNLTDGMDGLAAGCLLVAFAALAGVAMTRTGATGQGAQAVLIWSASLAGACLGFLWFNCAPASVFLGDVGALGLGAALGCLALLSHAALGLLIIGGVFVIEALSVMLQVASYRWRNKRRMFRVAPLHHHFQVGGMSEPQVVVRFWIAGSLLGALGFSAMAQP